MLRVPIWRRRTTPCRTLKPYKRIAVAVDFSKMDQLNISWMQWVREERTHYLLLHIVNPAGALMMKRDIQDFEFRSDQKNMERMFKI